MAFDPKFADDLVGRLSTCEAANVELAILFWAVIDRPFYGRPGSECHDVSQHHCLRSAMHYRATRENPGVRDT
jgi:hypothetical protein